MCDRPSRRELLTVGGLSLLGWSLPQLRVREAAAQEKPATSAADGFGKADAVSCSRSRRNILPWFGRSAWPKSDKVHPYDLVATIHHALGIDPQTEYHDTLNHPRRLVERGKPIVGLF